ncbi:MAG: NAD(+)--rifampin ADP-ribosyltransferase [Bacteroidetes bacterium]|nr:NAD(+)--rifampin ADP-ribosyltransferase [Bacteroidota bacterium]
MEFDPNNPIVKLCIQGMALEDKNMPENAAAIFYQAWKEATKDFEKYLSAHFIARHQHNIPDKIKWLEIMLDFALKINNHAVNGALPNLYLNISKCYEELHDFDHAKLNLDLGKKYAISPIDNGPFYHGTKANLQIGDLLNPGSNSNYQSDLTMNHIYFTALINGAGLAAALAKGEGEEHVYIVEPTGAFENDPNVTDKKFPGNPTRSYRSLEPLRIIGEVTDWVKQTPEQIQQWREKLAENKGEIIN